MIVAVVGSRDFPCLEAVANFINTLPYCTVVSGGARGVDTVAVETANYRGYPTHIIMADWMKHGKAAGFIRNGKIVQDADLVVAFWDGESHGTYDSIKKALGLKKPLIVVKLGGEDAPQEGIIQEDR